MQVRALGFSQAAFSLHDEIWTLLLAPVHLGLCPIEHIASLEEFRRSFESLDRPRCESKSNSRRLQVEPATHSESAQRIGVLKPPLTTEKPLEML
jgi:hypothetical protein